MDKDTIRCELRHEDSTDGPGRLVGVLMRYGDTGLRGAERFNPGSLRWPDNGIRVDLDHASSPARGSVQAPLLRTVPIVDGDEIRIDADLPDTTAARDLAVLMRTTQPMYTGLSVEFRSRKEHRQAGVRVIDDALLEGAALTSEPAYKDTSVEVRDEDESEKKPRRRFWL